MTKLPRARGLDESGSPGRKGSGQWAVGSGARSKQEGGKGSQLGQRFRCPVKASMAHGL